MVSLGRWSWRVRTGKAALFSRFWQSWSQARASHGTWEATPRLWLERATADYAVIPLYAVQWGSQAFNGNPTWISPNTQLQPAVVLRQGLPAPDRAFPDLRPDSANNTVADLIEPTGRQPTYTSVVQHRLSVS